MRHTHGLIGLLLYVFWALSVPVYAQVPLARYRPLGVGDRWVYVRSGQNFGACLPPVLSGYTEQAVVGDTLVAEATRKLVVCRQLSPAREVQATSRYHVAVTETATLNAVRVSSSSGCALDAAGVSPVSPNPGYPYSPFVREPGTVAVAGASYTLDGVKGWRHQQSTGVGGSGGSITYTFGSDLGLASSDDSFYGSFGSLCTRSLVTLVYAEVGGRLYGVNPVAGEAGPEASAPRVLRAYPLPARQTVTVEVDAPTAVDVFDALGRRVTTGEASPGRPLRLSVSAWPAGVYVARDAAGRSARLVVAR